MYLLSSFLLINLFTSSNAKSVILDIDDGEYLLLNIPFSIPVIFPVDGPLEYNGTIKSSMLILLDSIIALWKLLSLFLGTDNS